MVQLEHQYQMYSFNCTVTPSQIKLLQCFFSFQSLIWNLLLFSSAQNIGKYTDKEQQSPAPYMFSGRSRWPLSIYVIGFLKLTVLTLTRVSTLCLPFCIPSSCAALHLPGPLAGLVSPAEQTADRLATRLEHERLLRERGRAGKGN